MPPSSTSAAAMACCFRFSATYGDVEGIEPDAGVVSDESPWRQRIQIRPFDDSFAPGRRYDLIVMLDVLEHIEDPRRALAPRPRSAR